MIANREYTLDDYLAMAKRRARVILIPVLLAPLAAFLISLVIPAKYTSQTTIMLEGQKIPENMIQPVVSEDPIVRVSSLRDQVLSQSRLQPMIESLGLARGGQSVGDVASDIAANTAVVPTPDMTSTIPSAKKKPGQTTQATFYIKYTAPNPRQAQQICNELTSLMIRENSLFVGAAAKGTTDVLDRGLEDGKRALDDLDSKLAAFKKQYVGQLPGDEDNNFKILMGLNSQLEQNTSTLNRAQQDKTYTEALLAQQLGAWKSSQSSSNPQTLEKQLADLQTQLLGMQGRYTADHPDVIKAKADIAEVKKKLAEVNAGSTDATASAANDKASASEPPEIRQMRLQLHQYGDLITAATRDQGRLQKEISEYQGRVSLSPAIEEQYKALARDYDNAQKNYQDLLGKKSSAELTAKMTSQEQGERLVSLGQASPADLTYPNKLLFAGGGLGAGLVLGLGLALWLELRDKSIRTEADAEAALELPLLVAVPWVGATDDPKNGNGNFWHRGKKPDEHREKVGA